MLDSCKIRKRKVLVLHSLTFFFCIDAIPVQSRFTEELVSKTIASTAMIKAINVSTVLHFDITFALVAR